MRLFDLKTPSTCAWITTEELIMAQCDGRSQTRSSKLVLRLLDLDSEKTQLKGWQKLADFEGRNVSMLKMIESRWYLGVDDRLLTSDDLRSWTTVLRGMESNNVFWHMVEADARTLFVQEYGPHCSGIYRSSDGGNNWTRLITSLKIDKEARHFHCVAYDKYRRSLIATLGDSNSSKIVVSQDYGDTWKVFYRGAYQCLPIEISEKLVVFGMDSGLSKGLLTWQPDQNRWRAIHLTPKNVTGITDVLQASDLKRLKNGLWIMTTGGGSIILSKTLNTWNLCKTGCSPEFEFHPISNEEDGLAALSMIETTVLIDSNRNDVENHYVQVVEHPAYLTRLKASGSFLKHQWRKSFE